MANKIDSVMNQIEDLKWEPEKYLGTSMTGAKAFGRWNWYDKSFSIRWQTDYHKIYYNPFENKIPMKLNYVCS